MSYTIVNGSEMTLDALAPYMSNILAEMGRLAKRFPKDVTTAALFNEFLCGKRVLWLILKEGNFVSMAMTSSRTIDATGTRVATLNDLAGRDVASYAPELCATLEQWAANNNAEPEIFGRPGWARLLKQHDYEVHAVVYRKVKDRAVLAETGEGSSLRQDTLGVRH